MGVLGIGGIFFRANDPDALAIWYRNILNIGAGCAAEGTGAPEEWSWQTQAGPVVFAPFKHDTDYFPAEKSWMLNLRVGNLAGLLSHLHSKNVAIIEKDEWNAPEIGRFARIHDPEGNVIELWEPPA